MTVLFRLNRDRSRWKKFSLLGFGILVLGSFPFLSAHRPSGFLPSNISGSTSVPDVTTTFSQADDLLHGSAPVEINGMTQNGKRIAHWPPMSPDQIEQVRRTLIREGLSPMQADMIVPIATAP